MSRAAALTFGASILFACLNVFADVTGPLAPGGAAGGVASVSAGSSDALSVTPTTGNTVVDLTTNGITNTQLAQAPATTIKCNSGGSAANEGDCNPLQVSAIQAAVLNVYAATTANITLSGSQTIDGQSVGAGQVVLVANQSTSSQNGIYVTSTGTWTRASSFPSGTVLNQYCNIAVVAQNGTKQRGWEFVLSTTTGAITIGTSSQTWTPFAAASVATNALAAIVGGDCAAFSVAGAPFLANTGDDNGDLGPCIVQDANGHPIMNTSTADSSPTANHGTVGCGGSDNTGCITGVASSTTSLTITFGGHFNYTPACQASSNAAAPFAISVTAASNAAVTFTFASLAGTTTFYFSCL